MPHTMCCAQGNTAIELKLDQCLGGLIGQAKRGASGNLSAGHLQMLAHYTQARVPSWLHLPSLPAFTERTRMMPDDEEDAPAPPLSHYARDEALREVAIHGDSAAANLLIRSDAESSTPTSTPLAHSPIHSAHQRKVKSAENISALYWGSCATVSGPQVHPLKRLSSRASEGQGTQDVSASGS